MKVRITKVPDKKNESLNAKKWKHGDGGPIDRYSPEQIRAAIAKLKEAKK